MANKISILARIKEDIRIFIDSPKDYLFIYTYSAKRIVRIHGYNPRVKKMGDGLVRKIKKICPGLPVHFIGSANLRIPGQKDIDLLIGCPTNELTEQAEQLVTLFGQPGKKRKHFIEWHTAIGNTSVEVLLIDTDFQMYNKLLHPYQLFKSNPKLLKEYKKLKESLNGKNMREYNRKRLLFFNQINKIDA